MSPEHVPAPQLASPAGDAFGAPAFLAVAFAGGLFAVDGAALALAGADVASAACAGALVGGVGAAAADGGVCVADDKDCAVEAGAEDSALGVAAVPEQLLAEQDA